MAATASVEQLHRQCKALHERMRDSGLAAIDPAHQALVKECHHAYAQLWEHVEASGSLSRADDLEDLSTGGLDLMAVPFRLAELTARGEVGGSHARRVAALGASRKLYIAFLNLCENVRLVREEDIEKRVVYKALDRTARVEAHQRCKALENRISELEGAMAKERALAKRRLRIEQEDLDDDDQVDRDDAERAAAIAEMDEAALEDATEEVRRELLVTQLKLRVEEAFSSIQMNDREADMLTTLSEDGKVRAVEEYQRALTDERKSTFASNKHFPGASVLIDPELTRVYASKATGVHGPPLQQPQGGANYNILPCGHTGPLRHELKDAAFLDRNQPTQTLEEFAQGEMAFMAEQQQRMMDAQQTKMEEDAKLGEAGIEERERVDKARWDDWRDANPAYGITNKGNYS